MSQTGDGFRYSYLAMAVRGALFSLGLATMTLPEAVLANPAARPVRRCRRTAFQQDPWKAPSMTLPGKPG